MSDRSWKIFVTIVALIIISAIIFDLIQSRTSFKALVLDHIGETQEIEELQLYKISNTIEEPGMRITDPNTINMIMDSFKDIKLMATDRYYLYEDSYRMYISPKKGPTFHVTFNDQNIIRISNSISSQKQYSREYDVVNDFDASEIINQFKLNAERINF